MSFDDERIPVKKLLIMKWFFMISMCPFSSITFAKNVCKDYGRQSEIIQIYIEPDSNSFEVVSDGRLYFHSSPNKSCEIKNLFLIPGDIITGYTEYNGYISVAYAKNNSWSVKGWLDKSQLKNINIENGHHKKNHCELVSDLAYTQIYSGGINIPEDVFSTANKGKVIFYNAPDKTCPKENTFIIKGDNVYALKKYANFALVQYMTIAGERVFGWVLQSELKAFNPFTTPYDKATIGIVDFIVTKNNKWIGIGSSYNKKNAEIDEDELWYSYIGDFPNSVGGLYKYNMHSYKNLSLISSNINYDKRQYGIDDDYIVSAINLDTPVFSTIRGVKVGDPIDKIFKVYPANRSQNTPVKISFTLDDMYLDFNIKDKKILTINMGIAIPEEELDASDN